MDRPSKKDIKNAIDKLKGNPVNGAKVSKDVSGNLPTKKSNIRIRKQGV